MRILSFDCAHKSLAVTYLTIKTENIEKIFVMVTNLLETMQSKKVHLTLIDSVVSELLQLALGIIDVHFMEVYDTMPKSILSGKNKTADARMEPMARAIRKHLDIIANKIEPVPDGWTRWKLPIDMVLIEWQMNINDKSRAVSNQILSYFAYHNTQLVGPAGKNKVVLCDEGKYQNFIQKYSSTYAANKNHSKFNFLYLLKIFGLTDKIKHIPSKYHDDIADATMQIFGYFKQ